MVLQDDSPADGAAPDAADGDDPGLCVASIVITCATPMVEEPDSGFPPPPDQDQDGDEEATPPTEREAVPGAVPASSSTGSEESFTGPSTTEDSQAQPQGQPQGPKSPDDVPPPPEDIEDDPPPLPSGAGVKAEVPEDLEPHQLEKLQGLKESDA